MTTFIQFCAHAKTRHDYADMLQVRYPHPNGEAYDTWVSGEEVLTRLKTISREELIHSFSRMNWHEAKAALEREWQQGQQTARRSLKDRLAGIVQDQIGGNIFGDTLADNIRGTDSSADPREQARAQWHARLRSDAFRAVLLEIAWRNLELTLPEEPAAATDDWV